MLRFINKLLVFRRLRRLELRPDVQHDFVDRVFKVRWWSYWTAYEIAWQVPLHIVELASTDKMTACRAAFDLGNELCHQHVQLSAAANPALPFIIEALNTADDDVLLEGLYILLGFAKGTNLTRVRDCCGPTALLPKWAGVVRETLLRQLPQFHAIARSRNVEVREYATVIIDELNTSAQNAS
jgi:hypothetical protein